MALTATSDRTFDIETPERNVTIVTWHEDTAVDFERWLWIGCDVHFDNPKCHLDMLREHLDTAAENGAAGIMPGDVFCAMQGKWDKRASKDAVRPEHQSGNYLDELVGTAADFFEPYAGVLAVIGEGNHETKIKDRHETNLIERLCATLQDRTGHRIVNGGYSGWVKFRFRFAGTQRHSRSLWYHHGHGGGGVTKGMPQAARHRSNVHGADIMVSGHTHDWFADSSRVEYLNASDRREVRDVLYIKGGTYKDAYGDGFGGWEIEKGHAPKTVCGTWVRFFKTDRDGILFEATRAR